MSRNSPFTEALDRSMAGADQHPFVKAENPLAILSFQALAWEFAKHGLYIERVTGWDFPRAMRDLVGTGDRLPPPGLDHPWVARHAGGVKQNTACLVSETYRPMTPRFRTELDTWCDGVGLEWRELNFEIHNPFEVSSIGFYRPGQLPPRLELTSKDRELCEGFKRHCERRLRAAMARLLDEGPHRWLLAMTGAADGDPAPAA